MKGHSVYPNKNNSNYKNMQISGQNNEQQNSQQKLEYIPFSTIIRIKEPYKDISYEKLGAQ